MAKYNKEIVKEMSDWVRENGLIDYGGAKLGDFCKRFGIDDMTYYSWLKRSEYSEAIKKAKDEFKKNIETGIVKSLAKAAMGYEVEEIITEGREVQEGNIKKFKAVKQTRKKKTIECNVGAAIFLLTNIAPERWQNKQRQEISGDVGEPFKIIVTDKDDADLIKQMTEK